jgi:hypothetical protein
MSTLAVNTITNAAGGNTAQINGMTPTADSLQGFRNRIINGNMLIAQRGTAAVSTDGSFPVDRWYAFNSAGTFSAQQSADFPVGAGFVNSLVWSPGNTTARIYSGLEQRIEGFNVSDLDWGSASAKPVTVSFWVKAGVTATLSVTAANSGSTRNYPATYTVNAANTWEFKTITIPGDTTGTWLKDNGTGLRLWFTAGGTQQQTGNAWGTGGAATCATGTTALYAASANLWITGVQLEAGSVATPFERRPYGTELALCQRYYQKISLTANPQTWGNGYWNTTTQVLLWVPFITTMRAAPSALETDGVPNNYSVRYAGGRDSLSAGPTFQAATNFGIYVAGTASGTRTAGHGSVGQVEASTFLAWSAEL